jgi:hypothetical protein
MTCILRQAGGGMELIQDISCFIAENRIALISLCLSIGSCYFAYQTHKRHAASISFALHKYASFHVNKNIGAFQQNYTYLYVTIINNSQLPTELTHFELGAYSPIYRFLRNLRIGRFNILPYRLFRRKAKSYKTYLYDFDNHFPLDEDKTYSKTKPLLNKVETDKIRLAPFEELDGHVCFYSSAVHKQKPNKLYLRVHTSRKMFIYSITVKYRS